MKLLRKLSITSSGELYNVLRTCKKRFKVLRLNVFGGIIDQLRSLVKVVAPQTHFQKYEIRINNKLIGMNIKKIQNEKPIHKIDLSIKYFIKLMYY